MWRICCRKKGRNAAASRPGSAEPYGMCLSLCPSAGAAGVAAAAALADTPSALHGIGHLRGHETNRLAALVTEIKRIGGKAEELSDGLVIEPVPRASLHAAVMESYADHRMATFAAMIGLAVPGIEIRNIATTRKTIPDFPGMWADMLAQR